MIVQQSEHRSLCVSKRDMLTNCAEELWTCRTRYLDSQTDPIPIRNDEKQVMDVLTSNGFSIVGRGSARIVLQFPEPHDNLVVKLARYGENPTSIGMWQNKNEIKVWTEYGSEDIPLLPIYDWNEFNFRWVIMPHGETLVGTDVNPIKFEKAKRKLKTIPQLSSDEFTPPNFIRIDDTYYLADYGSLKRTY